MREYAEIILTLEAAAKRYEDSDRGIIASEQFATILEHSGEQLLRLSGKVRRGET